MFRMYRSLKVIISHQEAHERGTEALFLLRLLTGWLAVDRLPLDHAQSLLLFESEAKDLAHSIKHLLLRVIVTFGVGILD